MDNLFASRASVRTHAALQKPRLEVKPPTDLECWRDLQAQVEESKTKEDRDYWVNRLEHELFYRSQWRAINMEDRRREEFRELVDQTDGDCSKVYERELGQARELLYELKTRAEIERDGYSAGKRIVLANRVERAHKWVIELKEMGK